MRSHIVARLAVFFAALFCLGAGSAVADTPSIPSPRIYRLENGLTVLVREDTRFPLASVRLFVKAGSAWETPEEAGLSHFLEHMVFKGSRTRESGVDAAVENAGGYLNAYTSFDNTVYLTDLPSDQWRTAVEAVRDLAFDPLLREDEFNAEREVVLAEMRQRGDSPYTTLFHAMFETALDGTPYRHPVIGYRQTIEAATPESMRAYIRRRYDPRDMLLVVAGNVKAEEVLAEARRLFGGYPNRNASGLPEIYSPDDLARGLRVSVRERSLNKAYIAVSFPLPAAGNPRNPAADVLARMLGGDETALLQRRLRLENPLADSVSAGAMSLERAGLFFIIASMDGNKVEEYLKELSGLLKKLTADSFSDEEIARAKLNIEDEFWRGQETVAQLADMYGNIYFFEPSDPTGLNYLLAVRDVTREQIQAVLDDRFRPRAMSVTAVVPRLGEEKKEEEKENRLAAVVNNAWPGGDKGGQLLPLAEDKGKMPLPQPELVNLGKGRALVLWPDRSLPYVTAWLSFSGGDIFTPEDKQGLARLSAAMLTSATNRKDYAAMNAYLADRASGIGASAGLTDFSVSLDAPSRFSADIFTLFQEVLSDPAFSQEDFERCKRDQAAAIAKEEEDVSGVLSRNLRPFLFGGTVHGHQIDGSPASLGRITRDEVREFWASQKKQPWVLAVVGDFDREAVMAFVEGLPIPQGERAAPPDAVWQETRERTLFLPEREQAAYTMIFPTVPLTGEDSPALGLLSASLNGFGGLLFQELREKRSLGYSVSSSNWSGEKAGFLAFSIIAAPDNLDAALENFKRIAGQLGDEPQPQATVDRAKAMLESQHYRARQTRAGRAENASRNVLHGRPVDFDRQRLDAMLKLTSKDLRAVARKYLDPEKAYFLTVAPSGDPQQ